MWRLVSGLPLRLSRNDTFLDPNPDARWKKQRTASATKRGWIEGSEYASLPKILERDRNWSTSLGERFK